MNQKITCPHCQKEFPMEDGLSSHLKTIENQRREKAEKEVNDKFKKDLETLKLLKNEFASSFKNSDLVILSPVYSAGEKIDKQYDEMNFAKLISKNSKVQVITIKNEIDLRKFFIKNLLSNEIVICLGAGSISKWIREMNL